MELNPTVEDYLRSVYRLETRGEKVTNAALTKELGVSAAAVTDMVRRLDELGVVTYEKYQGVKLTPSGLKVAMLITRRHRLWEVFLIQHLGFEWDEVHELAHQLEHISSDILTDRLEEFLGYPTHDPHGDPIPTKEGTVAAVDLVSIAELEPAAQGKVARVSDEYPELLRYASSLGLAIGTPIRVVEKIRFDGSVRLLTGERESVISDKLASSVFVAIDRAPEPDGRSKRKKGERGGRR